MNTHMKAAVYERYGPPEVVKIRDVPIPQPRANDVLVRIRATTVSSGDWRARSLEMPKGFGSLGRLVFGIRKPRQPVLGTEFSGRIAAVGEKVTRFTVGDDVFGFAGAAMGSHAEYRCMDENDFIEVKPVNLTHEEAAALSFGGMTVLRVLRRANLREGERIAINGASGSIGVAAIQLAKHLGAQVTAIASGANASLVKSLGADRVIDYTKEDFTKNGEGYDVILDAAGTAPFSRIKESLTKHGRFIPVLGSLTDLVSAPWINATGPRKIISGIIPSQATDLSLLRELAMRGVYRAVIDRHFELEQIVEAHRYVDTGRKKGSVVVTMRPRA